jgi:accessory gene regulator protein AgrB
MYMFDRPRRLRARSPKGYLGDDQFRLNFINLMVYIYIYIIISFKIFNYRGSIYRQLNTTKQKFGHNRKKRVTLISLLLLCTESRFMIP